MPKQRRPENRGLPPRWTYRFNAYYYRARPTELHIWDNKQFFWLGKTLGQAYKAWGERVERNDDVKTVRELLNEYATRVIPQKKPKTQAVNVIALVPLGSVFGDLHLNQITPPMIYQYVEKRSVKTRNSSGKLIGGRVAALREIELLSHAFTKAVEWGLIGRHPFKGEIRLKGSQPRTRYVEDWEIIECLSLPSIRKSGSVLAIQSYIRLKLLTGMSMYDLLNLKESDLKPDGIHIQRHKTKDSSGKRTIYEWTPDLRSAVKKVKDARPAQSDHLFCNRYGKGYINPLTDEAPGWKSMWQHFMERIMSETKICEHFTQHDLRAKCASDAPSLEHARALLSHADSRTTARVYRRKPERVKPLNSEIYERGSDL